MKTTTKKQPQNHTDYQDCYDDTTYECINTYLNEHSITPKDDEIRGMWHRPFESSLEAVIETIKSLADMGINHLFVETYFNGKLIFDCTSQLLSKHAFVGNYGPYGSHLLWAFVEVGKTYGINIHAWVENFFIGVYQNEQDIPLLKLKPSWAMYNHDGTILQKNEVNYVFLDPANDEVQTYIKNLYQAILQTKGVKTLHLDYIRYPVVYQGLSKTSDDTGYGVDAFEKFQSYIQKKIAQKDILNDEEIYQSWCTFRTTIITDFVKSMYDLANAYGVGLSTAVFGDPDHAIIVKKQDWLTWVNQGWLEMICPMAYYKDASKVYHEVSNLKKRVSQNVLVCGGIAPSYMGLHSIENVKQGIEVRKAGADGMIFFATQNYLIHSFQGYQASSKLHADMLKYVLFKKRGQ